MQMQPDLRLLLVLVVVHMQTEHARHTCMHRYGRLERTLTCTSSENREHNKILFVTRPGLLYHTPALQQTCRLPKASSLAACQEQAIALKQAVRAALTPPYIHQHVRQIGRAHV